MDGNIWETATHCSTPQHTATHRNTPQHHMKRAHHSTDGISLGHCNTKQHTATHCNALPRTATHRNTPQHTATHRNSTYVWFGIGRVMKRLEYLWDDPDKALRNDEVQRRLREQQQMLVSVYTVLQHVAACCSTCL